MKRMQVINAAVSKMRGCVRQVELLNPSDASDEDIMFRAKMLLSEDQNYKKGFKFEHVLPMLKNVKIFGDDVNTAKAIYHRKSGDNIVSSQLDSSSEDRTSTHSTSPELSSFSLNINKENVDDTSTQQPIGVKKAKLERKNEEENIKLLASIKEENRQLVEILKKKSGEERHQNYEIQRRKLAMTEYREENKILLKDLNSIADPNLRLFFQNEQARILQKRAQQDKGSESSSGLFGNYFDVIGGSGSGLSDY